MKKFISLILAILILIVLTTNVFAYISSSGSAGENSTYTFDSGTGELIIEPVDSSKKSYIGNSFFDDESNLKKVTIRGITEIGENAFFDCNNLLEVKIENGTSYIGEQAFYCCRNLADVDLPETLEKIDEEAFSNCKISTLIFRGNKPEMLDESFSDLGWYVDAHVYTNGWEEILPSSFSGHVFFHKTLLSGSTLSEGNTWIIAGFAVVAVVAIAVVVAKKKKKTA